MNAELFGMPDRGRSEPGLRADLIAVAGDPLEHIEIPEDARFVMKAGAVYAGPGEHAAGR